jgi:hypothetical protein
VHSPNWETFAAKNRIDYGFQQDLCHVFQRAHAAADHPRQTLGFIDRLSFSFCEKPTSCHKKWQKCQMGTWKIFEHFCFGMFLLFRHVPPKVKFLQKPEPTKFSAQMGRFILEKLREDAAPAEAWKSFWPSTKMSRLVYNLTGIFFSAKKCFTSPTV